jgi:hypothetical protein
MAQESTNAREELTELAKQFQAQQSAQDAAVTAADNAARFAAANDFLNALADNFIKSIRDKVAAGDFQEDRLEEGCRQPGPFVVFKSDTLKALRRAEIRSLSGYTRLEKITELPAVDMCLGNPAWGNEVPSKPARDEIRVFFEYPYEYSGARRRQYEKEEAARLAAKSHKRTILHPFRH